MVSSDDPRHDSAAARAHLSAIANELARRTTPSQLKRATKAAVADAKDNLKGKAMEQREKVKDNMRQNPVLWGAAVGGAAGLVAGLLARGRTPQESPRPNVPLSFRHERRPERRYRPRYEFSSTRLPDEGAHYSVADGNDLDCGADFSRQLKSKTTSASAPSRRLLDASAEYPLALALAGIGLGIVAARVVPETKFERAELGKVRQRLAQGLARMGREMESRLDADVKQTEDTFVPTTENPQPPTETSPDENKASPSLH